MEKRGQSSTEYVMLLGFVIILLGLFASYGYKELKSDIKSNLADTALRSLSDASFDVANLGESSKKIVFIKVPKGVESFYVGKHSISYNISTSQGTMEMISKTKPAVFGRLPIEEGEYRIPVMAINQTTVLIGYGNFIINLDPNCVKASSLPQNITVYGVEFKVGSKILIDPPGSAGYFEYPSSLTYYIGPGLIIFTAVNTYFFSNPSGPEIYDLAIQDIDGEISNWASFNIVPNVNFCD